MNAKSIIKNLWYAFLSQGVALLCSILTTLLVPKIMGVEDYGYWQYFVFLVSYVSFFQLGINDGVYLTHGGESRSEINKGLIKSEFILSFVIQSIFMVAIIAGSTICAWESDKYFLYIGAAIYMVVSNATFFLGYVFQSMNETKLFSMSIVADRLVFLVPLAVCILMRVTNCMVYIVAYIIARCIALLYCMYHARDFLRTPAVGFEKGVGALVQDMKLGIVLTVANVCSMLILGIARYAIEAKWGISVFGQLSLSLSLVNFILMFISQLSMVLFPALRQSDENELGHLYAMLRNHALVLLPVAFVIYYPVCIFVSLWLPEYTNSLQYLVFLMPIVLYESLGDIICTTFFKVRCEPKKVLVVNAVSLAFAICGVVIAVELVSSIYAVMIASVAALAVRAYFGMSLLSKSYCEPNFRICASALLFCIGFVLVNDVMTISWGAVATSLLIVMYCLINKKESAGFFGKCATLVRDRARK